MTKTKFVMTLSCLLMLAACGENGKSSEVATAAPPPPPQNVVTRDDISDFCDSIPEKTGDDSDATKRFTKRVAETLGANSQQTSAMVRGASYARLSAAMGRLPGSDDPKSFQSHCRRHVREELFELTEK